MNNQKSSLSLPFSAPPIGEVIADRLSRRTLLKGALASSVLAGLSPLAACATRPSANNSSFPFTFDEIARGIDETHHVPQGYEADILLRWGDALFPDSPPFDPLAQTAAAQERQFGYNNDFIGFIPLDAGDAEARGILCVNHEYTNTALMFPGLGESPKEAMTAATCAAEMAAHGGTLVEIVQRDGRWTPVLDSRFNRRVTATTPMDIHGPAAGHERLKTEADPSGTRVFGTLNNCAGGISSWHSYLMSEENYDSNFLGALPEGHRESDNYLRLGIPAARYAWGKFEKRFDVGVEPNEPNRFGWVVEVDALNPTSIPRKRTALGRFKHEGVENVVARDGRIVVYMGDDEQFQHVYKFVASGHFVPGETGFDSNLLNDGTLYVARFEPDGRVLWLPLIHGEGPLTQANGFLSQADVLIETRRAAQLLGATPMDRPEDIEPHPATGRVYVMLTNNTRRETNQIDAANPRAENNFGHIIEITEPVGDFTATESRWEILIRCGDPASPDFGAMWNPATTDNGWFGSPDNCAIDPAGRLWVATDGNDATGANDGLWAVATEGDARGTSRAFFRAPIGAEVCGPRFAPDGRTLFLAVQHPGDAGEGTFENPATRWPDFGAAPPRPSVLAIRRSDGGPVGG
jgi:secreted PhoX family phosphatase